MKKNCQKYILWLAPYFFALIAALTFAPTGFAKLVRYDLTATRGQVNLSGKETVDWALMINGTIPAPTLEFTEGDDAEIVVNNKLKEEVSIHWHGILLPPEQDGVAYVNTPPILAGQTHTFRFKIRQHGTYWYHSHTMLQEQKGIYGALVIHPKEKKIAYDKDLVVVLSDWSDENADQIIRNLRKDGDYYLYKKDSVRSWLGAIKGKALGTYLHNEWTRMGGMDLSDVGYDAFLVNGRRDLQLLTGIPGQKVRLRVINAAASSYFYVSLGQQPMQVIAADGVDIAPVWAKEVLMGMAETYDLLFEIPNGKNTELRATAQDVTGYASGWIGAGEKVSAPTKSAPDMYATMDHGAHENHESHAADQDKVDHSAMSHGDHSKMDHSTMNHETMQHGGTEPSEQQPVVVETLTVDALKAPAATAFAKDRPSYELKLILGGDMERYVWHINGKAINEERTIEIRAGDVVRLIFANETMMHHPMHLHGHFFRVLTASGDFSPLKHTVDVPPHGTRTIEFLANEPGEWMLHCHNLYHMKTGMARVVKYSTFKPKPEIAQHQAHDPHLHDHIYFNGMVEAATNHAGLDLRLSQTWNTLEAHFETRRYDNFKHAGGDLLYKRWFSNFFNVIAGGTYFEDYEHHKTRGLIGIGYMLPLLIETHVFVDHTGKLRADLEKRFQWTKYIFSDVDGSFRQQAKTEIGLTLMYAQRWDWAAGLMFTEDSAGAGLQYKF